MSRNSYPSPVSSTASPNLDDNTEHLPRPLPEVFARDHAQTQHSLRQASAALEAAYHRIRQVRRSLLELSDTPPHSESEAYIPNSDDIGPAHEAIMLAGSPVEDTRDLDEVMDLQRSRSTPSSTAMDMLEQIETDFGHDEDHFDAERSYPVGDRTPQSSLTHTENHVGTLQPSTPSHALHSPLSPTRHISHPRRRPWLESQLSRRRDQSLNDSFTALGRRVAAREAAGVSYFVDSPAPPWLGENPPIRASDENMNSRISIQIRHSEPARLTSAETHPSRASEISVPRAASQPAVSSGSFPPRLFTRRWRAMRTESRQSPSPSLPSSSPSDRLSLLSNFSVQNLTTPTSNFSRDRPLLFDEPTSYVQPTNLTQQGSEEALGTNVIGADRRNHLLNRRIDVDGDQRVQDLVIERDSDDTMSWTIHAARERLQQATLEYIPLPRPPRAPLRSDGEIHHHSDANSNATSSAPPRPDVQRRRGWARLDPDGNEIPSDEEEELERARAQHRLRMLYQARANASAAAQIDPVEAAAYESRIAVTRVNARNLIPVTRTSISHGPDDDANMAENSPRVRLNSRDPRVTLPSFESLINSPQLHERSNAGQSELFVHEVVGSSAPFSAYPLPMPLAEMLPSVPKAGNKFGTQAIRLPEHASLAGR